MSGLQMNSDIYSSLSSDKSCPRTTRDVVSSGCVGGRVWCVTRVRFSPQSNGAIWFGDYDARTERAYDHTLAQRKGDYTEPATMNSSTTVLIKERCKIKTYTFLILPIRDVLVPINAYSINLLGAKKLIHSLAGGREQQRLFSSCVRASRKTI